MVARASGAAHRAGDGRDGGGGAKRPGEEADDAQALGHLSAVCRGVFPLGVKGEGVKCSRELLC